MNWTEKIYRTILSRQLSVFAYFTIFHYYFLENIFSFLLVSAVLYVLARHGQSLGAYKLARLVYERLRNLHLPKDMREKVELASLSIRTRPYVDSEVSVTCIWVEFYDFIVIVRS